MGKKISVIFSTKNENLQSYIFNALPVLNSFSELEIFIVDYKSSEDIRESMRRLGATVLPSEELTRAARLNEGIEAASCGMLLLHHPRSVLNQCAINELLSALQEEAVVWGGFTHAFDINVPLLNFTSWYSNNVRCDRGGILYLDHCIFFKKSLTGSHLRVPTVDIFEDTELSLKLLKFAKPTRLKSLSTTSSVRFLKNGIFKQSLMNQVLKVGYHFKLSAKLMNKIYERGLSLN